LGLVAPAQVDVVVATVGLCDLAAVVLVAGYQAAAECHASVAGIADAGACSSLDGDNVAQRLAIACRQPGTDAHGDWHQPRGAPASRTTPIAADRFWTELEEAGGHAG